MKIQTIYMVLVLHFILSIQYHLANGDELEASMPNEQDINKEINLESDKDDLTEEKEKVPAKDNTALETDNDGSDKEMENKPSADYSKSRKFRKSKHSHKVNKGGRKRQSRKQLIRKNSMQRKNKGGRKINLKIPSRMLKPNKKTKFNKFQKKKKNHNHSNGKKQRGRNG